MSASVDAETRSKLLDAEKFPEVDEDRDPMVRARVRGQPNRGVNSKKHLVRRLDSGIPVLTAGVIHALLDRHAPSKHIH